MYHQKKADEKLVMEMTGARWGDSWQGADATLRSLAFTKAVENTRAHSEWLQTASGQQRRPRQRSPHGVLSAYTADQSAAHSGVAVLIALTEEISQSRSADYLHRIIDKAYRVANNSRWVAYITNCRTYYYLFATYFFVTSRLLFSKKKLHNTN